MSEQNSSPPPEGQFLVYQAEDGKLKLEVRFEGEPVWLTQQHMAELFQTTKQNIGQHLKSIFAEGELLQNSVVKDSFTTAADGKNYATRFYNLDAIISPTGFSYRKSVNLGPFRVNLSKSGLGYSVGGRGFRVGTMARMKKYTSFSIPGTGVGYRKSGAGCLVLLAAIPTTLAVSRWLFSARTNLDAT